MHHFKKNFFKTHYTRKKIVLIQKKSKTLQNPFKIIKRVQNWPQETRNQFLFFRARPLENTWTFRVLKKEEARPASMLIGFFRSKRSCCMQECAIFCFVVAQIQTNAFWSGLVPFLAFFFLVPTKWCCLEF
jgi:hypothetical protein